MKFFKAVSDSSTQKQKNVIIKAPVPKTGPKKLATITPSVSAIANDIINHIKTLMRYVEFP